MRRTIKMQLDQDLCVAVEVPLETASEAVDRVQMERPLYMAQGRSFGEAVQVIRPVAEKVVAPLRAMEDAPDQMEVEFHFAFNGNADLVLTSQNLESNIRVKLHWNRPKLKVKEDLPWPDAR